MIEGVAFSDYLSIEAASSHAIGTILNKSPRHVKGEADKPSAAKGLGTVAHALILEPDTVGEQIVVRPENCGKHSNAAKSALIDWILDVTGADDPAIDCNLALGKQLDAKLKVLEQILKKSEKVICSSENWEKAQKMRDSVMAKPIGRVIFDKGIAEATMLAIDPETGVLCKIRPDWLAEGHELITDLKSALSAAFGEFSRASARYGYHIQASFYRKIHALVTGSTRPSFLHVVVENEPPYDCAFYEMDQASLAAGDQRVKRALDIWSMCDKSGQWPGIGYDYQANEYRIEALSLPKWAL